MTRRWLPLALVDGALGAGSTQAQTLKIHHLDVGQGDATLIVSPTGQSLLVDAGFNGMGTQRIKPYLQTIGISQLNHVVPRTTTPITSGASTRSSMPASGRRGSSTIAARTGSSAGSPTRSRS